MRVASGPQSNAHDKMTRARVSEQRADFEPSRQYPSKGDVKGARSSLIWLRPKAALGTVTNGEIDIGENGKGVKRKRGHMSLWGQSAFS